MKVKDEQSAQHRRFLSAARDLECDEDKGRFEAQLGKIASAKPPKDEPSPKRKKAKAK